MNIPKYWYKTRVIPELNFLSVFVEDIEAQIDLSIKKYEEGLQTHVVDENPEAGIYHEISEYKGFDSETWALDDIFRSYFPNLQRSSALITIYGLFENELQHLCLMFNNTEKYSTRLNEIKGKGIGRSNKYLKEVAGLDLKDGKVWIEITNIQKIRNLFAHHRGILKTHDPFTEPEPNFDLEAPEPPISKEREQEIRFIKENKFLEVNGIEVLINKGYLKQILQTFDLFYKEIASQIELKYPAKD